MQYESYEPSDIVYHGWKAGLVLGYIKERMRDCYGTIVSGLVGRIADDLPFLTLDDEIDALAKLAAQGVLEVSEPDADGIITIRLTQ